MSNCEIVSVEVQVLGPPVVMVEVQKTEPPITAVEIEVPGPPGPPGSGATSYLHTQSGPSQSWTVNHNLGFRPSVELFTTGWQEMAADVVHVSMNQFIVTFNQPTAGFARAN